MDKVLSLFTTYPVLNSILCLALGWISGYFNRRKKLKDSIPYIQVCPLKEKVDIQFYNGLIDSTGTIFEFYFREHNIGDIERATVKGSLHLRKIERESLASRLEAADVLLLIFQGLENGELIINHFIDRNDEFKSFNKSVSKNNDCCLFCKYEDLPKMIQCDWKGYKIYYRFGDNRKVERHNVKGKKKLRER